MAETTTIKGLVYKRMPIQNVSDKLQKRELILKTDGQYPQYLLIQFVNKNIDKLDNITTGSTVVIDYNLRGRLWYSPTGEEKCFSTIEGWNIKTENLQVDKSITAQVAEDDLGF
jgi:hypothetical protein